MSNWEVEALIEENKDILTGWLQDVVRGLSLSNARSFVEAYRRNLPPSRQQSRTKARASELPEADRRTLDRIFGNRDHWPDSPVRRLPDGRVVATHLYRKRAR